MEIAGIISLPAPSLLPVHTRHISFLLLSRSHSTGAPACPGSISVVPADAEVMKDGREGQLPRLISFGDQSCYRRSKVRAGSWSTSHPVLSECSAAIGKSLYLRDTDGGAETNHRADERAGYKQSVPTLNALKENITKGD